MEEYIGKMKNEGKICLELLKQISDGEKSVAVEHSWNGICENDNFYVDDYLYKIECLDL